MLGDLDVANIGKLWLQMAAGKILIAGGDWNGNVHEVT